MQSVYGTIEVTLLVNVMAVVIVIFLYDSMELLLKKGLQKDSKEIFSNGCNIKKNNYINK